MGSLDPTFFWNFMANALATFLGVLAGIPAALYLSRRQEARARHACLREEEERREKLLELTKEELAFDLNKIRERVPIVQSHKTSSYLGTSLKTELWTALSDGGELQWIRDLDLISVLAEAYYRLKEIVFLEGRYLELLTDPTPNEREVRDLCDFLFMEYRNAEYTVKRAIGAIDMELGKEGRV